MLAWSSIQILVNFEIFKTVMKYFLKHYGLKPHFNLKGQCPDYAHARASSVFSSKDNRTVILTRQDFLPDRTADGDLLFTFSRIINILDHRRSLSSYLKFGSRREDLPRFCY